MKTLSPEAEQELADMYEASAFANHPLHRPFTYEAWITGSDLEGITPEDFQAFVAEVEAGERCRHCLKRNVFNEIGLCEDALIDQDSEEDWSL